MKTLKILTLCLFVSILTFNCSSDDDSSTPTTDSLELSDFEGSWIATSLVQTNNANASESFNMIANGGELRYTMLPGGATRTWLDFGDFHDEWDSQGSLSGNILTMTPAEASRGVNTYVIDMENNIITLTNSNDAFDFTLSDETPVSATSVAVFVPNN